jgi:Family of unknown function (DUF6529)
VAGPAVPYQPYEPPYQPYPGYSQQPYQQEPPGPRPSAAKLLLPLLIGALVAVALGVYGKEHQATGRVAFTLGFSKLLPMKVWLASAAGVFGVLQFISALWMWRKLPGVRRVPAFVGPMHRTFGTVAFLLTVPVAYSCLYALGFSDADTRVLAHSILGCAFYGAFVTKIIVLRTKRLPGWALPVVGGLLFSILVAVVLTSAVHSFVVFGNPGF